MSKRDKKIYSKPVVKIYGDIHVITQSATMTVTHMLDGAMFGNTRT